MVVGEKLSHIWGTMPKSCSSCGLDNEDAAEICAQCGTALAGAASLGAPPVLLGAPSLVEGAPSNRILNASSATLIFLVYFGAQVLTGVVTAVIGFAVAAAGGANLTGAEQHREITQRVVAMAALPAMVASGLAMLGMCLWRVRPALADTSPAGAAWVPGSLRGNVQGFGMGVVLACGYFGLSTLFPDGAEAASQGPLARMAVTPGLQQIVWSTVALLFAPLIEECLFRGVLYGGFRRSFGPIWAAVLSTLIFWSLHLSEIFQFWPAMLAILGLALLALWNRLRCAALGPAVAVHVGYNGMMVLAAVLVSTGVLESSSAP